MKKYIEHEKRGIIITKVYSILTWIFAISALFLGSIFILFSSKLAEFYYNGFIAGLTNNPQSLFILVGIIIFVSGIIGVAVAWGLWVYKNWARILTLVLIGLSLLFTILDLFVVFDVWSLLAGIFYAIVVYVFGFYSPVVHLFNDPFITKNKKKGL